MLAHMSARRALGLLLSLLAIPAGCEGGEQEGADETDSGAQPLYCRQRGQDNCESPPFFGDTVCTWHAETYRPIGESPPCDVEATFGTCVEMPTEGAAGCPDTPRCGIPGEPTIFSVVYDDGGEVEFLLGSYCGIEPVLYDRCVWSEGTADTPGTLEQGPAACDCWCE